MHHRNQITVYCIQYRAGTLAEWLAHRTHNPMMDGSNPGRSNQSLLTQFLLTQEKAEKVINMLTEHGTNLALQKSTEKAYHYYQPSESEVVEPHQKNE